MTIIDNTGRSPQAGIALIAIEQLAKHYPEGSQHRTNQMQRFQELRNGGDLITFVINLTLT